MPDERFVTVAEAAALLGLSERQVRRYAGRLAPDDRREPDIMTGSGRTQAGRLRLSAIEEQAGRSRSDARQEPDTGRTHDRQGPDAPEDDSGEDWRARALVAEALAGRTQEEVAYLRAALEREQATAAALVAQLRDADARLALVAASSGRLQIGPQEPESGQGGQSAVRDGGGGSTGRVEASGAPRASWWARLWGKG